VVEGAVNAPSPSVVSPLHQPAAGSPPRPGEHRRAAPLDRVSDFPAIPDGWAYLDTAATAQKPRAVIDAITRGYAETYATVHRGVYQRSADMTLAFEAARRRTARFINARVPEEIVFTRGATESINLVAHSWAGTVLKAGDRILLSSSSITATSSPGSSSPIASARPSTSRRSPQTAASISTPWRRC
jgi:cysteine desulfurase/selenocysteine lyase